MTIREELIRNRDRILFIFAVLSLMEPGIFKRSEYDIIDTVYSLLKLVSLSLVFGVCIKKRAISRLSFTVIVYEAAILFSILVNGNGFGGIRMCAGPSLAAIEICLVFDAFREDFWWKLKSLRNILMVYYILNIISVVGTYIYDGMPNIFRYMGGGHTTYFLGIDNRFVFYFLPGLVCAFILSFCKSGKPDCYFYFIWIQSVVILGILWSVGAFLVFLLITFFFLVGRRFVIGKYANAYGYISFWGFMNIFLIAVVSLGFSSWLTKLAELLLHKGANLSGRFSLWMGALEAWKQSPLIGVGVKNMEGMKQIFSGFAHAHNLFINILVRGGCVAVLLFFIILFTAAKSLMERRKTSLGITVSFLLFCCLILSLADTFDDVYFYMILVISYYLPEENLMKTGETEWGRYG